MTRAEAGLLLAVGALIAFVGTQAVRAAARPVAAATPDSSGIEAPAPPASAAHVQEERRYSVLPPPDRDTAAVRRLLLAGGNATWIGEMLAENDSTLARWPVRGDPVRVWVQAVSAAPGWAPEYSAWARDAFGQWEMVGLPVRFALVSDSAGAEVRVTFVERLAVDTRIGNTRRVHDQHWWVLDGDITIATHTVDGRPLPADIIRGTALHEVGHLLGLGHTGDTTSVMAPRAYGTTDLTVRDLATVRLLYSLPPGKVR